MDAEGRNDILSTSAPQAVPLGGRFGERSNSRSFTSLAGSFRENVPSFLGHAIPVRASMDQEDGSADLGSGHGGQDYRVGELPEQQLPEHTGFYIEPVYSSSEVDLMADTAAQEAAVEHLLTQPLLLQHSAGSEDPGNASPQAPQPANPQAPDPESPSQPPSPLQELLNALAIGVINTIVTIPGTIAFVAIMFPSARFRRHIGTLAKLVFAGSAGHQLVFSLVSSLPFAIGQVQDIGLIFLSAMATKVEAGLEAAGDERDSALLTNTLLSMTVSTAVVGALLLLVGRFRLASLIAYIPLPVVAGYLGYVGYFCLAAGASQVSGKSISSISSWVSVLDWEVLPKAAAGVGTFLFIYVTMHAWRHPLSMPTVLCVVPVIYYLVLSALVFWYGMTWHQLFERLGADGWIALAAESGQQVWQVYGMYNFGDGNVHLDLLLRQIPVTLALFLVVTFGSCLDITAIQASLPYTVDYNKELITVGLSNLLTGVAGAGFTGSYIFSQTTFTQRSGCTHPLNGAVVIVAEAALFLLPVSFIEYLPAFYYGALMLVFGVEIMGEWLVASRSKFSPSEYRLTLVVFVLIMACTWVLQVTGLEVGIAVGVLVSALHFAVEYSKITIEALTAVSSVSACVRPIHQRIVLELFASHMQVATLTGYIFFGSAVSLGDRVSAMAAKLAQRATRRSSQHGGPLQKHATPPTPIPLANPGGQGQTPLTVPVLLASAPAALVSAEKFLVLDLSHISGMDATAAAAVKKMVMESAVVGVTLVLTGVGVHTPVYRLLAGNGVVSRTGTWQQEGGCPVFESLDDGLAWCEQHFLQVSEEAGLLPDANETMTLEQVLFMHLQPWGLRDPAVTGMPTASSIEAAAAGLQPFLQPCHLKKGQQLYKPGDSPDAMYILLSGEVVCAVDFAALTRCVSTVDDGLHEGPTSRRAVRHLRYAAGGVVGDMEFCLQQRRSFGATCRITSSALRLTATQYRNMLLKEPQAAAVLQQVILHNEMRSTSNQLLVVQRSGLL